MPYITSERRNQFNGKIDDIINELGWTRTQSSFEPYKEDFDESKVAGDLNYIIYSIVKRYVQQHGEKYNRYNMLLGALDCCSKEIYRRLVAPYEDECIKRNGDV